MAQSYTKTTHKLLQTIKNDTRKYFNNQLKKLFNLLLIFKVSPPYPFLPMQTKFAQPEIALLTSHHVRLLSIE